MTKARNRLSSAEIGDGRRWKLQRILTLAAGLAVLIASAAPAHHSGAMYDQLKTTTLTGTVRQFQWTNPHCFIQLVAKDDKGQDVEWSLEMTAPVHLQRLGWRKSSLKPGDRITVKFHPLRNGEPGGNVLEAFTADGKPVGKPA
ncbi:DUF6152 family protein [Croceibacterium salegens]|nr:DUF6152 family protein [Croceibacterium salegens]